MPTMQNKTMYAAAVTCSDSRVISVCWMDSGPGETDLPPRVSVSSVLTCSITWRTACISKDEREDARLTNEGMLMILCLEVEELLKSICSTSLNDAFMSGKRRKPCPRPGVNCFQCFQRC